MKIILLHYAAPPVVGGVESVMAQHARLMAQDGHEVCMVAGRGEQMDERVGFQRIAEVDSRHPEVMSLKAELDAGRIPAGFEPMVERIGEDLQAVINGADLLIAHNVCSLNKNLALTAALHRLSQRGGPQLILWHHDLAWTTPRYRGELHDGYPWDLLRTDWPWATQVVVSEARRRELAELTEAPLERIRVAPNGIGMAEFFKLEDESRRLCEELRLSEAEPLMLLPVRITPRKNIELALQVLAALQEQKAEARLVVTGPLGPHNPANSAYLERLRALRTELGLANTAHFLAELVDHALPDRAIADLYKLSDLVFLPSREEGFGIPILEAGLTGIPMFCSDIPPLRELGQREVHYFAPDGDPVSIAGEIERVLAESQTYGLKKRILREYSWKQIYRSRIAPLLERG